VPPSPPPLPDRYSDMPTIVGLGSLAWAVAAVVLLVLGGTGTGFVVCVVGAVLGGVGYGIFRWQRSAARRGSRTAQRGLR
jgi:Flp pilus assembly protein TadB